MSKIFNNLTWYPPAETRIPWSAITAAFNKNPVDFKSELRNYLNVQHCILAESARALLYKLLEALKKADGARRNEVLIPGYTCYSVAAAVAKAGLKISVYDLDPKTLHADPEAVEKALSEKTLAVVTQHLFGMRTPIDQLKKITHNHGACLIEDAAQAFGKNGSGAVPETTGDFGIFSFGRGKPLPVGGGGALVSSAHPEIMDKIKLGAQNKGCGKVAAAAAMQIVAHPGCYWIPEMLPLGLGETVFDPGFPVKGISFAVEAMLARAMASLDQLNAHRMIVATVYFRNLPGQCQIGNHQHATSMIRYPVFLPGTGLTADLRRLGIRRMYPQAIRTETSIQPYLKAGLPATPGAQEIAEKLFTLPTHMGISESLAMEISHLVQKTV